MKFDLRVYRPYPRFEKNQVVGVLKLLFYIWKYESSEYQITYRRRIKWNYL